MSHDPPDALLRLDLTTENDQDRLAKQPVHQSGLESDLATLSLNPNIGSPSSTLVIPSQKPCAAQLDPEPASEIAPPSNFSDATASQLSSAPIVASPDISRPSSSCAIAGTNTTPGEAEPVAKKPLLASSAKTQAGRPKLNMAAANRMIQHYLPASTVKKTRSSPSEPAPSRKKD